MRKPLSLLLALVMVIALCPMFAGAESAAYTEAPVLAAKVGAGELPPVAERLPANPNVLTVAEVGIYEIDLLPAAEADPLFSVLPQGIPVAQYHQDAMLEAPEGAGVVPGDLVVGIVRRPDPVPCPSCAVGEWDMCRNGQYTERGIKAIAFTLPIGTFTTGLIIGLVKAKREWK